MSNGGIFRKAGKIGYGTLLIVAVTVFASVAFQIGVPFWVIPMVCALYGLLAWFSPNIAFPRLSNSGTKKTFSVIAILTALLGNGADTQVKAEKTADAIIAASRTGAGNAAVLLAGSNEDVLTALDLKSPKLSAVERLRRQREADASAATKLRREQLAQRAEQQRVATANAAEQSREEAKAADEAEAQRNRQKDGLHCLSTWDGSYRPLAEAVKESLRNPDSFELIETRITPETKAGEHLVIMKYRAQNGFGGMNVERAMVTVEAGTCALKGPIM